MKRHVKVALQKFPHPQYRHIALQNLLLVQFADYVKPSRTPRSAVRTYGRQRGNTTTAPVPVLPREFLPSPLKFRAVQLTVGRGEREVQFPFRGQREEDGKREVSRCHTNASWRCVPNTCRACLLVPIC